MFYFRFIVSWKLRFLLNNITFINRTYHIKILSTQRNLGGKLHHLFQFQSNWTRYRLFEIRHRTQNAFIDFHSIYHWINELNNFYIITLLYSHDVRLEIVTHVAKIYILFKNVCVNFVNVSISFCFDLLMTFVIIAQITSDYGPWFLVNQTHCGLDTLRVNCEL